MSDTVDLDFLEFVAELGVLPQTEKSRAAAAELEEARSKLRQILREAGNAKSQEDLLLKAMDVSLAGIRLNDRKLRLLAVLTLESKSVQADAGGVEQVNP